MSPREERRPLQLLADIDLAIAELREHEALIEASDEGSPEARAAFSAILYELVVIGEAANGLPAELREGEPHVPWRRIVDMRNFLAHEYFAVSPEVVHSTIDEPLEELQSACEGIRARVEE